MTEFALLFPGEKRFFSSHLEKTPSRKPTKLRRFPYLSTRERNRLLTESTVRKMVARAGVEAKLSFPIHPHMLRRAAGFKLANDGQDTRALQHYLGHRNITHTVRYTELSSDRFKNFWQD
ncbi:MAG: tyrosine-type recombinase/integrase [Verrucomicrobia bacterium]|nr:tyrosine-type recombinase/integrase [Verrucomicrobiota bacterium]